MKAQVFPTEIKTTTVFKQDAIELLKNLIAIPSFSKEEDKTANEIFQFLKNKGVEVSISQNNVWCKNKYFNPTKPTILLNSHHDTVKPNTGYTHNPFEAKTIEGKLFGLGSNDAGGALVSLLATFLFFYSEENLKYNLIYAATAEEEISGTNGISSIISQLSPIEFAIVGEPTLMQMAVAEKGLMVLDCISIGKAGHAARQEGENAIYKALKDIEWFKTFSFPKTSSTLGEINMNVTIIKAGMQHNVVPSKCEFTVDIRTTDVYTNEEVLEIIKQNVSCEVKARSLRLQPSYISLSNSFVEEGIKIGIQTYGSPTLSDQALMPWSSVKMGPGDSKRSHSADEFIYLNEIEEAIDTYTKILKNTIA